MKELVCQNNSSGTESPDKATGCLEKNTDEMTEKQNSVKTCTRSLKKSPPINGNR